MNNTNIQTTVDRLHKSSSWKPKADLPDQLAQAPYVVVRPTNEWGDTTIPCRIEETLACQFIVGFPDRPPDLVASIEDPIEALEIAFEFRALNPTCAVWYEGEEVQTELNGWNDLAFYLHDEEERVERSDQAARDLISQIAREEQDDDEGEDE